MKVDKHSAYKLIFSIRQHPKLGPLVEPYVIALSTHNTLTLTYQKVFSGNADHYDRLSQEELALIEILDGIMPENIIRRFSSVERIRPKEYFSKYFNIDQFRSEIRPFIEEVLIRFLADASKLNVPLYRADEINPASQNILYTDEESKALFHFRRDQEGTRYFATVKYKDQRIPFMKVGALILTQAPAFMVVNNKLLYFNPQIDGAKLAVFLNRKYIQVPKSKEREYFENFVVRLFEKAPVNAVGFKLQLEQHQARPYINIVDHQMELGFQYGPHSFSYHPHKFAHACLKWNNEEPVVIKVRRARRWEEGQVDAIRALGWDPLAGSKDLGKDLTWLSENYSILLNNGFSLNQELLANYCIEKPKMEYTIVEDTDWFDVNMQVHLGDISFPFKALVGSIKRGDRFYKLSNGQLFLIPEEWFALGQNLENIRRSGNGFKIPKYQLEVLQLIPSKTIKDHLLGLESIREEEPDELFKGTLRPYQKDGLSWIMFLYRNGFGGILADDMGLGKTVQTLAFLQKVNALRDKDSPALLVAPTSLLFNWEKEAEIFTPNLNVYIHKGQRRNKEIEFIKAHDLVVTSYGLIRNDFEILDQIRFSCIVLDESQYIKNQSSKSTQLINKLHSDHRLCLTGTPIENSIKDLWSQMNFLNKGLLGSSRAFQLEYVKPIEKEMDKDKMAELSKKVKTFVLRRTKQQVAKDLPALTEKTILCEMSPEQKSWYEEIKSQYRNELLDLVEKQGVERSKLSILQGLTKLRQLANHPKLLDEDTSFESGKHQQIMKHLQVVIEEDHKVLIFSQFVSYLKLLSKDLRRMRIPHFQLYGETGIEDRNRMVESFQNGSTEKVFLISLKAGGVGLNLTAADYVFITDPWWNPAAEAQARDRTHRIGQTNKVISYKFISDETVEEKIITLQNKKKSYASDIIQVEDNIIRSLELKDVRSLFN